MFQNCNTEMLFFGFTRRRQGMYLYIQVVLLGSCFAENFGTKLHNLKFRCDVNPFGILFNPHSISRALRELGPKVCITNMSNKSEMRDALRYCELAWTSRQFVVKCDGLHLVNSISIH